MYDPELGRFMQTDPLGYGACPERSRGDSMNLYQYCGNNPVNWIDPWGLCKYHDEEDTQKILDDVRKPGWSPWQHRMGQDYDYAGNGHGLNTFVVDGREMSASEFGNYLGGYAATYHLGHLGYIGMRMAGNMYKNQLRPWVREDEESIREIYRGYEDGLRDRNKYKDKKHKRKFPTNW